MIQLKKRKLLFIATGSPLQKRAHGIAILSIARRLARYYYVCVVFPLVPSIWGRMEELKKEYRRSGVNLNFVLTTSMGSLKKEWQIMDKQIYAKRIEGQLHRFGANIIYTRDVVVAEWLGRQKKVPLVMELHELGSCLEKGEIVKELDWRERDAVRRADGVVALTEGIGEYARGMNEKVVVIPNAVEDAIFYPMKKEDARGMIGEDRKAKIAVVAGLARREGLEMIEEVQDRLHEHEIEVKVVGMRERVSQEKLRYHLAAADVIVMPYAHSTFNDRFTSPLKMFEFMGMRKPIVATKVGGITGILSEKEAFLVGTQPKDIAEGIVTVIKDEKLAKSLANNAYRLSKGYTYKMRAKRIADFLRGIEREMPYYGEWNEEAKDG